MKKSVSFSLEAIFIIILLLSLAPILMLFYAKYKTITSNNAMSVYETSQYSFLYFLTNNPGIKWYSDKVPYFGNETDKAQIPYMSLAHVDYDTGITIPSSIDYKKWLKFKQFLLHCEQKYHISRFDEKWVEENKENPLSEELLACLKYDNFNTIKGGAFLMRLKCQDFNDEIKLGNPTGVCVERSVLLFKGGKTELCRVELC